MIVCFPLFFISPDRVKTESGEFRTGRKVEIFSRLRAAYVVFKKKIIKVQFSSECKVRVFANCSKNQNKGRDTRCDKLLRHVAATGCCNKSPRVTCENHCRCDRILSLRSVARIQTGLNSCDKSQRQNMRKRVYASATNRSDKI